MTKISWEPKELMGWQTRFTKKNCLSSNQKISEEARIFSDNLASADNLLYCTENCALLLSKKRFQNVSKRSCQTYRNMSEQVTEKLV